MISFVNFRKSYGSSPVLDIRDGHLDAGLHWIRGANGSGKTTLLKSIAGIISFEGDVILQDRLSLKKNPVLYRSLVNFAEAEPVYPGFLTAMEMISLFADAKQAPENQHESLVESMDMTPYLNDPVSTFSSGMMKKLSLVLAFIGNPELILLDEPLITLDNESVDVLGQWISRKSKDGTNFLISSHQPLVDWQVDSELRIEGNTIKPML